MDSLSPLGLHAGPKSEIIWETVFNQFEEHGLYEQHLQFLKRAARLAEGPALLEGYRVIDTGSEKVVTFEPWADLARTLSHTANALVGTFSDNGQDSHGLFQPFDRQIVTNQAGLYGAHQHGIALSKDGKLIWGASLGNLPDGATFLADHITEVVWREGIVAIELCRKLEPELFAGSYSAVDADRAHEWLISLVDWRLCGVDRHDFERKFGFSGDFDDVALF